MVQRPQTLEHPVELQSLGLGEGLATRYKHSYSGKTILAGASRNTVAMETASLKQRLMVGCGPQWTYRRMLYSGLLLLQLRISGPCLCLEESMEEQDEKPQGSLKACMQVSGASLLLGD